MYDALSQIDYRLAGWSWGMWDWHWWRGRDAAAVAARLQRKASPGDIIVIHDGHHRDPRRDRSHAGGVVRSARTGDARARLYVRDAVYGALRSGSANHSVRISSSIASGSTGLVR